LAGEASASAKITGTTIVIEAAFSHR